MNTKHSPPLNRRWQCAKHSLTIGEQIDRFSSTLAGSTMSMGIPEYLRLYFKARESNRFKLFPSLVPVMANKHWQEFGTSPNKMDGAICCAPKYPISAIRLASTASFPP